MQYQLESSMFSTSSIYTKKYLLKLFNIDNLNKQIKDISNLRKKRIIFYCSKMLQIFSDDIVSMLKIFNFFDSDEFNNIHLDLNINTNIKSEYVIKYYYEKHFIINNYIETLELIKKNLA